MVSRNINILMGLIGFATFSVFILGLAHSISIGFAGFWGGLPFWVISLSVIAMGAYDFWKDCLSK